MLTKLIDYFTIERARFYALATFLGGCGMIFSAFIAAPQGINLGLDFPAFYDAGRIVNEYPRSSLYDKDLQQRLYLEAAPTAPPGKNLFFAYTPFFALFFAPLAVLPHSIAFVCWILISIGLFIVGFCLAWSVAGLPNKHRKSALLIAISFVPFYAWCVLAGQTSAFGFFWLALAIYLDRKRPFASGLCLGFLLYKPPLLILLVPMLLITRRWRSLFGFCAAAVVLAVISLTVIGVSGVPSYLEMLRTFAQSKAAGNSTAHEIDLFSFFLPLVGRKISIWLVTGIALLLAPFLFSAWRRQPRTAWVHAITWTVILNFYVLIYDATFVVLSVVLFVSLWPLGLPRALRWLLVMLFVIAWPEADLARISGLQPMTVVLVAFGVYQLAVVWRGKLRFPVHINSAPNTVESARSGNSSPSMSFEPQEHS